ncbi:pre-toxin TG domain-containing protein [Clostridium cibarium]|uniref:Pre-toxin TG domain-containing protein n=1 Tax=Clostridium cibarium TaxID=2762247 RepID=A0ABR8PQY2_9CLOT|nr:pre-toxin TG domain-containing protein [Clostridium cibarium]MBD7910557.1 pre-toxin TG domain-containing protein [Clostridium cibarium]
MEDLGLIRIEDISVKNNLGIEESGVTEEGYEYTREKAGLTFQDLLTYEGVSDVMKKQYEEYKENAKNNNEEYIDEYGKYLKQTIEGADVTYEKAWEKWVSLGLDVIPIVGDAKGLVEAVIGMDLITQRKLSDAERALSALSAIPLVGDGAVLIKVGSKYGAKELLKVSGKELIRNVGAMGTGYISMEAAEKAGLPPWVGLLAYQGTRISAMGVSKYGGTVSARVKGVESGGFLDNMRIETPDAYKTFMKNLQEGTKDKSLRLSSLGAGEFERIYRSNENLRKIVTEVDNLGLTAEESKRVRAILDSGDKETIENLAQVVVKYKGDKDRILGFVDAKGARIAVIGKTGEGIPLEEVKPYVLKQIYPDDNGAYGYLPNEGTAYHKPEYDFTDVDWAKGMQNVRRDYLEASKQLEIDIERMSSEGFSKEDIAKHVVDARNQQKVTARANMRVEERAGLEARNIKKYGNPIGPTVEGMFNRMKENYIDKGMFTSDEQIWEIIIQKSMVKDDVINTLLGLIH